MADPVIGFGDLREYCGPACVQTGGNRNVRFYRDLAYLRGVSVFLQQKTGVGGAGGVCFG